MKIHFFEEFPTKANLKKLNLVTWPCKLFLASESLKKFNNIKIKSNIEKIYWPILKKEEGYWISPFSKHEALKRIFNELTPKTKVMLDLELPFRKPSRFLNIIDFFKNKKLIKSVINNTKEIYSCENAIHLHYKALGISFDHKEHPHILMFYSSMLNARHARFFIDHGIIRHLKNKKHVWIALGTIATGILGNEPILSPKNLEKDLIEMKKLGIKNIVIFRLAGLNKEYLKIIKKYVQ
jgi:hypothetical protein